MAFLNEQGVQTLWTKIKDHTATKIGEAVEDVRAEIPKVLPNPESLNFKNKDNGTIGTYDGSDEINVKAGSNIVISENEDGDVEISAILTGVTVDNAKHAATADEATKAEQDASGNVITTTYATKNELSGVNTKIENVIDGTTKVEKAKTADTATNATTASKVSSSLTIKMNNGTTESTTTYNGSAAKEVNITPAAIGAQPAGNYATTAALEGTEAKITKIVNGTTEVGKATSAGTATTATSAGKLTTAVNIALTGDVSGSASFDGSKGISITTTVDDDKFATTKSVSDLTAVVAQKLEQSDLDNYATKSYADTAEADAINAAKGYTDEKIALLLNNTDADINSIKELSAAIEDNEDAIEALNAVAGSKLPNTTAIIAGTGISVTNSGVLKDGVTITNAGVRSIATGSANGTISVNTNGTSANVAVKGLGTAAYKADTYFATATSVTGLSNTVNNLSTSKQDKIVNSNDITIGTDNKLTIAVISDDFINNLQ